MMRSDGTGLIVQTDNLIDSAGMLTLEAGLRPCMRRRPMARILLKMLLDCNEMHLDHATAPFS
jgi:hypothetical protein